MTLMPLHKTNITAALHLCPSANALSGLKERIDFGHCRLLHNEQRSLNKAVYKPCLLPKQLEAATEFFATCRSNLTWLQK